MMNILIYSNLFVTRSPGSINEEVRNVDYKKSYTY